jgi:transcriptional regulator with XRE-family HTH domain
MDTTNQLGDFLKSRRARVSPQQAGLLAFGSNRRVSGLRREEAAMIAGISVEYYTKLERDKVAGVSASVFDGLAQALQLDEAERAYLAALLPVSGTLTQPKLSDTAAEVPTVVKRVLAALGDFPAYVRNQRFDILATNPLGRALYSPQFEDPVRPANMARFLFLDPRARDYFLDWEGSADQAVSYLRAATALDPQDRRLATLIGDLSQRSDVFRAKWADHNVRFHNMGVKQFNHPIVGALMLDFQSFEVSGAPGLRLNVYTAAPGSVTSERLARLAAFIQLGSDVPVAQDFEPNDHDCWRESDDQ